MWALAKAVLLIARYFRRIAVALEAIQASYSLDLRSRGIFELDPKMRDKVEVSYGPQETKEEEEEYEFQ